mgnify:CR=1 FL=1
MNLLVVVQDVLQLLPANERKDSVVIQVHNDVLTPMVMGDSVQLSQVLLNVLRNAVQAQVAGKPVHIDVRVLAADGRWQVAARADRGGGADAVDPGLPYRRCQCRRNRRGLVRTTGKVETPSL